MNALLLKFPELAEEEFAFLEGKFGFRKQPGEGGLLRYERDDVLVLISYDGRRSYEVSLEVGRKRKGQKRVFNFGELLRSVNAPQEISSSYQVTSEQALKHALADLARSLRVYCESILQNDDMAFARLNRLREREGKEYALLRDLMAAREKAKDAWNRQDYPVVVKALSSFRDVLTKSERQKLEFSKKKTEQLD